MDISYKMFRENISKLPGVQAKLERIYLTTEGIQRILYLNTWLKLRRKEYDDTDCSVSLRTEYDNALQDVLLLEFIDKNSGLTVNDFLNQGVWTKDVLYQGLRSGTLVFGIPGESLSVRAVIKEGSEV